MFDDGKPQSGALAQEFLPSAGVMADIAQFIKNIEYVVPFLRGNADTTVPKFDLKEGRIPRLLAK